MRYKVSQWTVSPRVPEAPVARGPVNYDKGDQDTEEEHDQHGILGKIELIEFCQKSEVIFLPLQILCIPDENPDASYFSGRNCNIGPEIQRWASSHERVLQERTHLKFPNKCFALDFTLSRIRVEFPNNVRENTPFSHDLFGQNRVDSV